ncbi:eukaryotic-like serine/threonine-protein kinase [Frankia sp. AiPs1]|uniref:WD40 repeat domain-containing serine/threonine protein kinase n=1 Tax=Frankia sp. AiPa1 TaxID=573492 RepID=UPI00202B33B1|nr:serine/threonine-protein kinase [Frankia sp. AiPa1]MCL9762782.1 serine/threonine protein kinase [Frankia sp. AiPa1]
MIIDRRRVEAALPGYVLTDELGSGAFGLVLAARHRRMDRPVAIKVMKADGPDGLQVDFATEARILGGLDHPHIVRVHDYLEADDLCLIVMELLTGGTLTRRRAAMNGEQACASALAVAAALAHAHSRGILHRDIKPDNIIFTSDGTPKVGDFGIAKLFDGFSASASRLIGTPQYMAPEQFDQAGRLGPATDLYSLGVVLYRLLSGRLPFDQARPWQQPAQVDGPPPLRGVPTPIAQVVLRALAREPGDRHPDATAFASDLARAATDAYRPGWVDHTGLTLHLPDPLRRDIDRIPSQQQPSPDPDPDGEAPPPPAGSPEPTRIDDARPAARRVRFPRGRTRRWAVPLSAAVLVVALTAVFIGWIRADDSPDPDRTALSRQLVSAAGRAASAGQPDLARRLTVAAYRTAPTPEARVAVLRGFGSTDHPLTSFTGHQASVTDVTFNPSGTLLASSDSSGSVRLWDTHDRGQAEAIAVLSGHQKEIGNVRFSPDGELLATRSDDHTARIWDVAGQHTTTAARTVFEHTGAVGDAVFSPDSKHLATTDNGNGNIHIWDTNIRGTVNQGSKLAEVTATPTGHDSGSWIGAVYNRTGTRLATSGMDGKIELWDTSRLPSTSALLGTYPSKTGGTLATGFSRDGTVLATRDMDGTALLFDVRRRAPLSTPTVLRGHEGEVWATVISPDGRFVATGGRDGTTHLWATSAAFDGKSTTNTLATFDGRHGEISSIDFSPDGRLLATGTNEGTVVIWDTADRSTVTAPLLTLTKLNGWLGKAVFSPDGRLLAAGTHDWEGTAPGSDVARVMLWNLDADRMARDACAHGDRLTEAEWHDAVPATPYLPPCQGTT